MILDFFKKFTTKVANRQGDIREVSPGMPLRNGEVGLIHIPKYPNRAARRRMLANDRRGNYIKNTP